MTPSLLQEALTYLNQRALDALAAYDISMQLIVNDGWTLTKWHTVEDLNNAWIAARIDAGRAAKAEPCQHTTAQRSHEAQRCQCCWTISTYIRLSEPKENDNE